MTIKNLYKYVRDDCGTTVSPIKPPEGKVYDLMYRLIADEEKAITDGTTVTFCTDVESYEGWHDCDLPESEGGE